MLFVSFFSKVAILIFLLIIILYGLLEGKNVFELFIKGVVDGEKVVFELFPILLGLIVAIGMLQKSGFIYFISNYLNLFFEFFKIEKELIPLILLRPISR